MKFVGLLQVYRAGKLTGGQFKQHSRPGWSSCCDGKDVLGVSHTISGKNFGGDPLVDHGREHY
ncbi:hypothetical protein [Ruminiclostridium cellobioparum]|uniref:hypothetical protein n=1 Tax=Ruminiclostridium cellobioparum TaxID=29355 RepID=UPI0013F4B5F4|nr:hypothetical protein [Ruminiclostridium cellobioparum]